MSGQTPDVEPIAIIGLGCRFPGGADTPEKLWDLVYEGRQCWQDVPSSRYNWKAFHHPDPETKGTHNSRGGFFLDQDLAAFDATFFGIPAAEAAAMDPQQRLLLEVSYEAIENAGMPLESLRGTRTGVYVALVSRDYDRQIYKDPYQIPKHHLTGCGDATACGRISYVFDFKGPCMSLDTGCSGGLVALHLACQALRLGESDNAIVGGTNLLLSPDMTIAMSALRMINDEGRCYPFDDRGSGYGRAEGVAVLVLKRLKDALRDGDNIRAIVRNTGVNSDGKTNGILLPSSEAQAQLTGALYNQVGINPGQVSYVEAHGTGTQAGDAAEVNSIKQIFVGTDKQRESPLFLGSIKANIGHSESTSGLAGVIKTIMVLEKSIIPPIAALETVKPSLSSMMECKDIILPKKAHQWPRSGPRLASVNSFGFGGTNAHIILESAPAVSAEANLINGREETNENGIDTNHRSSTRSSMNGKKHTSNTHEVCSDIHKVPVHANGLLLKPEPHLFVISAKSKISLEGALQTLKQWVSKHNKPDSKEFSQLAKILSSHRSRFSWRSSVVASSCSDLLTALESARTTKASIRSRLVYLFTGQGAQYYGMGRDLIVRHTIFAQSLYQSQAILTSLGASWRLVDELLCEDSRSKINSSELSQPATTAIQIALVDLLRQINVRPAMVLGHSSGEVAAAYAAGILDHEEALTISYHKGFVAGWCKETTLSKGAMLAVGLGEAEVMPYLQSCQSGICEVGCVNSPSSVTLSGDEVAIAEMQQLLDKDSVFNRRLKVDIAYHSHHMKAISGTFLECLGNLASKPPENSVRFFSSVTGSEEFSPLGAKYWINNLISQVRFAPALENLARTHFDSSSDNLILLEIGPHAALQGPVRQVMNKAGIPSTKWSYNPSLVRNKAAHEAALEMVGSLFENGIQLEIPTNFFVQNDMRSSKVQSVLSDLPSYSWDHSNQYWHESRLSKDYRFRQHAPHDLLGVRLSGTSTIEPVFRHILSVDDFPWLHEHIIDGFALYPGSAFLCMAIEALRQISNDRGEKREISNYVFQEVSFSKALIVPDAPATVEVLLSLKPSQKLSERLGLTWEEFRVMSVTADGKWNEHCQGSIRAEYHSSVEDNLVGVARRREVQASLAKKKFHAMRLSCQDRAAPKHLYDEMRRNGIDYGSTFSIIEELQLGDHQAIGKVRVPDIGASAPSQHMRPHIIHPAVFDAFMHIVLPLYHIHCSPGPVMLVSIANVSISANILNKPGDELVVACRLTEVGRKHGSVEVSVLQEDYQGNLTEVGSLSREDFRGIGEGGSTGEISSPGSSSTSTLIPRCYHLDWIPAAILKPESHQNKRRKVVISCLSNSLSIQSLANDIPSLLEVNWGESSCDVLPYIPDTVNSESIHVIIHDASYPHSTFSHSTVDFSTIKSILWVNIYTYENPSLTETGNGLAQKVRQTQQGLNSIVLDYHIDEFASEKNQLSETVIDILLRCFAVADDAENPIDREYVYWKGDLLVPRLVLNTPSQAWLGAKINDTNIEKSAPFHTADRAMELHFKTPGVVDSGIFVSVENKLSYVETDEVLVRIYTHAINQVDVVIAQGRGKTSDKMVGEFSGEVLAVGALSQDIFRSGDRVCGWGSLPLANIARVKRHLIHRVDDRISFLEAASIPLAFQTAAHALINIAKLEASSKVLIHGAAGAVGQAAISIAHYLGAEVFATVGSSEKEMLLMKRKNIQLSRIFSSLSATFSEDILRQTAGQRIDIVLNCSSGDLNQESMSCIADFGYLIDITKSNRPLSLGIHAGKNITFATIDMQLLAEKRPMQLQTTFATVMALYHEGKLSPITPIKTYSVEDFSNAFRLAQSPKHFGKIVLTSDDETSVRQMLPPPGPLHLSAEGKYLVLGGDEILNRSLCAFLQECGAGSIVSAMFSEHETEESANCWSAFERLQIYVGNAIDALATLAFKLAPIRESLIGVLFVEQIQKSSQSSHIALSEFESDLEKMQKMKKDIEGLFKDHPLQFFISISSAYGLVGTKAHAICSVENTPVGCMSTSMPFPRNSVTLRLPGIKGTDFPNVGDYLGVPNAASMVDMSDLCKVLEYCMTTDARQDGNDELFVGIDRISPQVNNPVFSILHDEKRDDEDLGTKSIAGSTEQQIANAATLDEMQTIVSAALVEQLASLLALDPDEIHIKAAPIEIGLDSILAIEFKNWVVRTMQAPMQTSEILDAPSLVQLAQLILQRSKLGHKTSSQMSNGHDLGVHDEIRANSNGNSLPAPVVPTSITTGKTATRSDILPAMPIPELKVLLERHLSYIRAFATDEEFKNTLEIAAEFQTTGSIGKRLYDRLHEIKRANPDNWYHDLYLRNQYLVRKGGLAPYMSFFFTHPTASLPGSQAARAAIVVSAVIQQKYRLDRGEVKTRFINEQAQCMDLSKYLFNACREPKIGLDVMRQYPKVDYFVLLRRGHVYKVNFEELDDISQRYRLESIFEAIIEATSSEEIDWLSILTAEDRRSWAKYREAFMNLSEENTNYIQTIERSAFVVCLDDGSPETSEERGRHFQFADGSNRWNDKPIEYVITTNGVSGIVSDHTGLDAGTILELNLEITERIRRYQKSHALQSVAAKATSVVLEKVTHTGISPDIAAGIQEARSNYLSAIALREHNYPPPLPYGSEFMKTHKIPANSGCQLLIQLAARYYFGTIVPCWETVLQSNFRTGRVELNQVVTMQVAAFINAAVEDTLPLSTCRKLFIEAARTHSSSVLACTRGNGSDRFLSILRDILQEGEEVPRLFLDPVFKRSRPRQFCSNSFTSGMAEDGCCLRDETGIWVHHEVLPEQLKFSIVGPTGKTSEFYSSLVKAGEKLRDILNA